MLFLVHWTITPENQRAANERFKAGGAPPPDGVRMLGRWHSVATGAGTLVCETSDPIALCRWTHEWSDLLDFQVVPAVDDQGVATVIG